MTTRFVRFALPLLAASGLSWSQVTILAAPEFRPALEDIRKAFQDQTGIPTRVTYGSSGTLAQKAKAPGTDIFLASDKNWADSLAKTPRADEPPIVLGSQPVCVWVRGSGFEPSSDLSHLTERSPGEIVLADTLYSPGAAAVVTMLHARSDWASLRSRLVVVPDDAAVVDSLSRHATEVTEIAPHDTSATKDSTATKDSALASAPDSAKAAHQANAKATKKRVVVVTKKAVRSLANGFLPQTLLWNSPQSGPLAGTGRWTPVAPETLPPLLPSVIRLKSLNAPRTEAAKQFLAFLQSPRGRSILRSCGFLPPP